MADSVITELSARLDTGLGEGVCPAAQAGVISRGRLVHSSAHGADHRGRSTSQTSLFDVASVTKLAATTLATAVLLARRELSLGTKVVDLLPAFSGGGKDTVTVRELLAHGSGLPAWEPLFVHVATHPRARSIYPELDPSAVARDFDSAREVVREALFATELTPLRGQRVYSDLGFMVLGLVLETATRTSLDRFCRDEVFAPFGLDRTGFFELSGPDPAAWLGPEAHLLPTGLTRPREPAPGQESLYNVHDQRPRAVLGEVDDDHAYALGGVAGHAGLFSTAEDLARLGWLIIEELAGAERLGAGEVLREMARPDRLTSGPRRGLGFDIPAAEGSLAGSLLGRAGPAGAVGHLGFTGCSLWLDLDRELVVALLSNRVFPTRRNVEGMRAFRPAFHDAVVRALAAREGPNGTACPSVHQLNDGPWRF